MLTLSQELTCEPPAYATTTKATVTHRKSLLSRPEILRNPTTIPSTTRTDDNQTADSPSLAEAKPNTIDNITPMINA